MSRQVTNEPELVFDLEIEPLVPDNSYELVYVNHKYVPAFGGNYKLVMTFRIVSQGEHYEKLLKRFYNVHRQNKMFSAPKNGYLTREMRQLFGNTLKTRGLPLDRLKENVILGKTRTVESDYRQKKLGEANQYSIIDQLVKVL